MTMDSWVLGQVDSCSMDTHKHTLIADYVHVMNQFDCVGDDSSQPPMITSYILNKEDILQPDHHSPILGSVVMSYQRPRDFPGRNRPDTQRFLTPLGWAVRFPDGRIVYENRMGRQGPQPRPPRGGFPSPRQFPGQYPRQPQGQYPGQSMGGFSGQSQAQYQGQSIGGFPGLPQGQFPGQFFGQLPSQSSTQSSSGFPGMVITQSLGQMPGVTIIQPPGQSPGVFISPYPGQVLGQTPAGQQTAQQPPRPKPRQRFRIGPERVRLADLKDDETDCPICYRDYYSGDSQNEPEDAVRIGCGHVYGRRCLDKWIQETDTCPTCRGKLDLVDDIAGNP
ncbi:hypothetical protein O988_03609 [Pseudogymnoascus sp. VKM F-3808]|nr:hypothetical protein O988_03609 [Pseudogymnoascus sp. VKM F-3808]